MTAFTVIIPARMRSTRLPGKMLADIAGKPLVVRVVEQARKSGATRVVVATDHPDIARAVEQHGADARMTSGSHETGTDRLAEAALQLGLADEEIIVNVQGDEPLIDPGLIRAVAATLEEKRGASIATAVHPIEDARSFFDPNVVKVVCDAAGYALYFSRAPIPYARDAFRASLAALPAELPAYRHVGIYAYRARFLREYSSLAPTAAERFEALEQLRALGHGHRIAVCIWDGPVAVGVDTAEDLARVRTALGHS